VRDVGGLRIGERIGQLNRKFDGAPDVQRATIDQRAQRLALHELEHQKPLLAVFANFEQGGDVRVRQRRGCSCGIQQLPQPIRIAADRGGQHFDGDGPAQTRVPRAIDLAQAPGAEVTEDLVMGDRVRHYFFGGFAGRSSTRLGRLRVWVLTRSSTTCATSSGRSFQSLAGSAWPMKSVFTEPGQT
jgi:hypothetical protein